MLTSELDHVELSIRTVPDYDNNHGGILRKKRLRDLFVFVGYRSRDLGTWKKIVEISCVIAVILDPLFFYIPYIDEENKCLGTDKKLRIASLLLRSLTDISFIFSIAFQIHEWKIALSWNMSLLSLSVFIDFLAVLPIPQVLIVAVFFKTEGFAYSYGTIWNFFLLLQYLPRIYRIYLWSTEIAETRGFLIKSAFYFFLYIICSHVLGGFWYFFAIQRETSCWHQACLKHSTCMSTFSCDGNSSTNITSLDELCPISSPDATQFDFGIFIDSLQSNNKASINFPTKFFFSFWWALRNISSLGSNLETSNYLWENCFAILICIIGLPLFLFLIGNNVQTYMQMNIAKSEDIRQKLRNKRFDIEMWLFANDIPRPLRTRIITHIRRRLEVDKDADLDNLFSILPVEIRKSIKLHLLKTLRNVLALPLSHRPLFPGFYMPIYVKDPKLLAALQESRKRQAPYAGAFLVKDEPGTDPSMVSGSETEKSIHDLSGKELFNRLNEVGTLAQISSIQGDQVVLIGRRRLRITEMVDEDPVTVKVDHLKDKPFDKDDDVIKATSFEVISTLRDVLKTSSLWRDHAQIYTQHISDFNFPRIADFGAAISGANKLQCQQVLEELDVYERLKLTLELVKKEIEISKIQASLMKKMEEKMLAEQRRSLLNEQLKAIKKELGVEADDKTALFDKFRERLEPNREKCPPNVLQVIEDELSKMQLLDASSSEFNVARNYLDWLISLPWGNYSDENFDVLRAQKILDEDHYGLTEVKERILEFIAVGKLRGMSEGKIICLGGPPGVGKTSIGRSIARAMNRNFFRFSVGGLTDVAEIKGHRRTYIGAMPGKMVQCLKTVGTANPLVLIDEIDKLGRGHGGDPANALLELLDPEQNANFLDHYLDVPIDLSKVLFVCTANIVHMIPTPLLDRMEVVSIAGYITDEKIHIAREYLEKTTREACGIEPEQVEVTDAALLALIENYCRESGVRNLQKHIEKIYRKIALQLVRQGATDEPAVGDQIESLSDEPAVVEVEVADSDEPLKSKNPRESEATKTVEKVLVDSSNLPDFVGKPVFHAEHIYEQTPVGVVMGLAWTAMGGCPLYIETTQVEQAQGRGVLQVTGQLGDVMRESAQIAHIVARSILLDKEPDNTFFADSKLHLHIPAGAIPKDGPSAGCTMITSMLSLSMKKPVKKDLAMTGEVTLTGRILPIGGVKEKTIAARRGGVKTIIFPSANTRDYEELAPNVKQGLDVHFVDDYSQIFNLAFSGDEN